MILGSKTLRMAVIAASVALLDVSGVSAASAAVSTHHARRAEISHRIKHRHHHHRHHLVRAERAAPKPAETHAPAEPSR